MMRGYENRNIVRQIEQVDKYRSLGIMLTKKQASGREIIRRIAMAKIAFTNKKKNEICVVEYIQTYERDVTKFCECKFNDTVQRRRLNIIKLKRLYAQNSI